MKACYGRILSLLICASTFIFQQTEAVEKTPRCYTAKSDDNATFRWRTSLDVILDGKPIQCGSFHDRLRIITDEAAKSMDKEKNDGINSSVAATSLTVVFRDKEGNLIVENEHIYGSHDTAMLSSSTKAKKDKMPWFTTATTLQKRKIGNYYTPITYESKAKLEESAQYILDQIGLNKKDERLFKKSNFAGKDMYSYVDAEFQIIHELFYNGHFFHILSALEEKHRNDAILLIILHIHTPLDLCSMCSDVLCKLSETVNYNPEGMLTVNKKYFGAEYEKMYSVLCCHLCNQLKTHDIKFLIEVSSERPYNPEQEKNKEGYYIGSRKVGVDNFYVHQLQSFQYMRHPIVIPSSVEFAANILRVKEKDPRKYFPPFVALCHYPDSRFESVIQCKLGSVPIFPASPFPKDSSLPLPQCCKFTDEEEKMGYRDKKKIIRAVVDEKETNIRVIDVYHDGSCGYYSMGLTREDAAKLLLAALENDTQRQAVIELIAPEIEWRALANRLPDAIVNENANLRKSINSVDEKEKVELAEENDAVRKYLASNIDNIKKENPESDQTWQIILSGSENRIAHEDGATYTHEELVGLVNSFSKKSKGIKKFLKVNDELTRLRSQIQGLVKTKDIVKLYINSFVTPSRDIFKQNNPILMNNQGENNWLDINHQGGVADALAYLKKKDLIVINGRDDDPNRNLGAIMHEYKYAGNDSCGQIILVLDGVNYMRGEEVIS